MNVQPINGAIYLLLYLKAVKALNRFGIICMSLGMYHHLFQLSRTLLRLHSATKASMRRHKRELIIMSCLIYIVKYGGGGGGGGSGFIRPKRPRPK